MRLTIRLKSLIVICGCIVLTTSTEIKAQQTEQTPTVIKMPAPVVVNFQHLADYELTHPVKKKRRFIEQGEDLEKNGTFTPQPLSHDAVSFNMQTGAKGGGSASVFSAAPVISFNGTMDNGSIIPPDIRGAAGTSFVMETTNQEFKIYTKAGALNSTLNINTFFNGAGGTGFFDPHIIYDNNNNRFVICIAGKIASNSNGAIFIAVSQTSNPTGSWWLYSVNATGNTVDFMDYPLLGLNNNWVVVTGRNFKSTGPVTPTIFVWNRSTVYAGTATTANVFADATNGITIAPAHTYDNAQNTEYLVCNWNGNSGGSGFVRLSSITGTAAAPVYSSGSTIGVASPWNDNGSISVGASQSGTANKIESGDSRIGNAVFINGSLWFTHTAYLPAISPTRSAVDWWQVNPVGPVVQQFGRIDSAVASGFNFYSSIAVNPAGDALIGYCHSSSNMFPSAAYSFHAATDPAGSSQTMFIYKNGLANYFKTFGSGRNRYGDYTMSALDPVDNSFWNFSEWAQAGNNWGTVIANVASSGSAALSSIATTSVSPLVYCAGAAVSVPFTVNGTANAGNIFTAQLSNSVGSFAAPTAIGTLTSTTAGTISATIPVSVANGTGYRIRVVSSNPVITGTDNGANITLSAQVFAAGQITGLTTVCAGVGNIGYSVTAISGATTYNWTVPDNCIIQSGQGTAAITVAFSTSANTGNITVTGINGTCAGASSTLQVTVNPVPSTPTATDVAGCAGSSVTLSGNPAGGTFSVPNPYTGSSTTYTYTVANGFGCTATSAPASITVNPLPSCSVSGNNTVCQGAVAQWCAPAGLSAYLWSNGASTQCISVSNAGTYTVTVTNANGCTSSCSQTLTVNTLPSCLITGTASICQGGAAQWCSAAGGVSYLWSTGATTQCTSLNAAGTYTVTVTNANGCTSSCTKLLIVNALPACAITGNTSVCSGNSTQWCATSGMSIYLWSTGATTQCINVSASGNYAVTITDANGCSSNCSQTLSVGSSLICSITGNASICQGSLAQWCAPSGLSFYLWNTGSSTQCINVSNAGTYTVTVTDANGCSGACSSTLNVNGLPSCLITGNTSVCAGGFAQWCAPSGLSAYLWSNGATTQCIAVNIADTYTVTVTDANGCTNSCNATLLVNSLPVVTASNVSGCAGTAINLSGNPSGGSYSKANPYTGPSTTYTYTFTDGNGCTNTSSAANITTFNLPSVSFSGLASSYNVSAAAATLTGSPAGGAFSGPGISGNTFTPSVAGIGGPYTITYTYTDANGCTNSTSNQTTVVNCTVPSVPTSISTVGGFAKVCPGDSKTYTTPAVSGATSYLWTPPAGATVSAGQGSVSATISYGVGFIASDSLKVAAVNACGTGNYRAIKITRNTPPSQPGVITGLTLGVCGSTGVPYSVTNVSGLTYNWSNTNTNSTIASGQGTSAITADYNAGYVTGSLKVTANNGCGISSARSVTVKTTPATPSAINGSATVCANQSGVPYSTAAIASAVTYTWVAPTGSYVFDGITLSSGTTLITTATNVTVNFGSTAGSVKVRGNNVCGSGSYLSKTVTFNCRDINNVGSTDPELSISPNPNNGNFTILFNSKVDETCKLLLLNTVGQEFYNENWDLKKGANNKDYKIANDLAAGIYYVVIKTSSATVRQKVVKE